jgi:hypothetical protein
MIDVDLEKLIPAWVELYRTPDGTARRDELYWSYDALDAVVRREPDPALDIILAILRADQSDTTYANLSAGPLEDLLAFHGPAMIDRIEAEAARNPEFRRLLGGVWKNQMSEEIWARVQHCWDRRGWDGNPE